MIMTVKSASKQIIAKYKQNNKYAESESSYCWIDSL